MKTIAVDLTPLLPGGENGGAKMFALELVHRLSAMAPQTRFVLLTQAASHEELAALDRENVRRELVLGPTASALRPLLFRWASRVLVNFPDSARRLVARFGYRLNTLMKRGGSGATLRRLDADLLFCPFTAPTFRVAGIPTVCTVYDLQFHAYPQFFTVEDAQQRERAFTEACRSATALAAISDYSRDAAIALGGVKSIRTIHLRLARTPSPNASTDLFPRLGVQPGKFLLYPANFWKHKNHEMLLAAFAMARRDGLATDMCLVCTGAPGPRQEWLARAAHDMGLGERVLFPGFLPADELSALMSHCRGVVFPSLYEGFGLPVVEAMAAGVPVACGNLTALPEVAGDAALLFDPRVPSQIASAMISIVQDEALRARLVEAGKSRAAEFTDSDRMAAEYWALFESAWARGRGA